MSYWGRGSIRHGEYVIVRRTAPHPSSCLPGPLQLQGRLRERRVAPAGGPATVAEQVLPALSESPADAAGVAAAAATGGAGVQLSLLERAAQVLPIHWR
jgi:hypothetical protein